MFDECYALHYSQLGYGYVNLIIGGVVYAASDTMLTSIFLYFYFF